MDGVVLVANDNARAMGISPCHVCKTRDNYGSISYGKPSPVAAEVNQMAMAMIVLVAVISILLNVRDLILGGFHTNCGTFFSKNSLGRQMSGTRIVAVMWVAVAMMVRMGTVVRAN